MGTPHLEVTYRQGKALAAYLYLKRQPGDKSARSERHGSMVVDFAADGRPIGIEFTSVRHVEVDAVNALLATIHLGPVTAQDLAL